jgi:hypothetical protein
VPVGLAALTVLLAAAASGCGSDDKPAARSERPGASIAKVGSFKLRESDLPPDYRRQFVRIGCYGPVPAHPAFAHRGRCPRDSTRLPAGAMLFRGCTRGQVRVARARICESAAFAGASRGAPGNAVGLFAFRYRGAGAAALALERLRRVALSGYDLPAFPEVRYPHLVKHSLAVSMLGDDAPRGVVVEYAVNSADAHDSNPNPALAVYLWRRGRVVAGLSFTGDRAPGAALHVGDFAEPAMLRLAQRVDASA